MGYGGEGGGLPLTGMTVLTIGGWSLGLGEVFIGLAIVGMVGFTLFRFGTRRSRA